MKKIAVENASLIRNRRLVIDSVSFLIQPGESVAIYGPNGAGKTTLLNLILGLIFCTSGSITVGDTPVNPETARSIRLITGYVPQNFETDPRIPILAGTVVISGCYGKLGPFRYPDLSMKEKAKKIMEKLEISHIFERPFGRISGGERQKTMIARTMMQEPEILLLDEPFSSISETSKTKIIELMKNWQKENGLTVVLVSHEKSIVEKMCSRILYIEEGKIISQEKINGTL